MSTHACNTCPKCQMHEHGAQSVVVNSLRSLCCLFQKAFIIRQEQEAYRPPPNVVNANVTLVAAPQAHVEDPDVTLVTAYFNIGSFPKGTRTQIFTPTAYKQWMRMFAKITNPVVAYFDDASVAALFTEIRASGGQALVERTKIVTVNRSTLWSFGLLNQTAKIFAEPEYPRFLPNTEVPAYPCAMHAKYEVMSNTVTLNPFQTKFFAWIDVGFFRSEKPKMTEPFRIGLPPMFNTSRIGYGVVNRHDGSISTTNIIKGNAVWVSGGFFIAHHDVMSRWTRLYMEYVQIVLDRGLMNSDQQVIYAMVNDQQFPKDVEVQAYTRGRYKLNKWYLLGNLCMKRSHVYVHQAMTPQQIEEDRTRNRRNRRTRQTFPPLA